MSNSSIQAPGSSLFSVERDSGQPEGRKRIAQRFIAGSGQPGAVESWRDDRNHGLRLSLAGILSSLRDFRAADSEPSDKSLGYFLSSLRDSRPAAPALPWARRTGSIPPKTARNQALHRMPLAALVLVLPLLVSGCGSGDSTGSPLPATKTLKASSSA